eukprot:TRINITY_DN3306_c0_g1_i2.p1 TRINITY_DN3306_c0_g1~~TRINITY_DN3306_c0_g1_i2.p1  ORF type:complete len:423 (-),score=53.91 TRINITY_DN3306_c0_g1_i2:183-1451(-)
MKPTMSSSQSSHAFMQFLNSVLSQRGPQSLPYEEEVKLTIRQHLVQVIQDFPGLQVKTAMFTHNDGRTVNLLQADGTIPMYYQDVKYNIPVTMWLLEAYPRNPPLVYVTPTRDMIIKPRHPCVDGSGMVTVSYLQQWLYPRSNLVELVQNLSLVFGQDPPLYSRPPAIPSRPPPPTPSFHGMNPMLGGGGGGGGYVNPNLPPPHSPLGAPGNSQQIRPYPPYTSQQQQPPSSQHPPSRTEHPSEVFKRNAVDTLTVRLQRDSEEITKDREREMENLFSTQSILTRRADEIEKGVRELQQEKEGLEAQLQVFLTNTDVLESWLKENDKVGEDLDIDSVYEPADALSKQLLDCTAADLAVEDILYSLDRAAQEGVIPVDQFLKHVRTLAREQFFHRATCAKVKQAQVSQHLAGMAARANPHYAS